MHPEAGTDLLWHCEDCTLLMSMKTACATYHGTDIRLPVPLFPYVLTPMQVF